MMDHDSLIDTLSATAKPVRRVAPAWLRALLLVPLMLGLGLIATDMVYRHGPHWSVPGNAMAMAGAILSLSIGIAGLVQALSMSIAGGVIRGKGWMMAALAAWLAVAAMSIGSPAAIHGPSEPRPFCFAFLLIAGFPMVAVVIAALRRTRSLRPTRSLVLAGFSVAFLSFGLLAFCHPVELSVPDFVMHLMAALILGLLTVAVGRRPVAV